jgi:photosystem II stability/assembly factor-like uncharacterized protein
VINRLLWPLLAVLALNACGNDGEPTPPPTNVQAAVGDTTIALSWDYDPSVTYWVFLGPDASLTTENWTRIAGSSVILSATSPLVLCGRTNGTPLYFTINGRTGSAPGGPGSPTIGATPRPSGATWRAGSSAGSDLSAVGYAAILTCRSGGLATGRYIGVGPAAAIVTSEDGSAWSPRTAPSGFATDLLAVAALTGSLNTPSAPDIRYVAVGAGGASIYSTDAETWAVGAAFDAASPSLRALALIGSTFVAVGDGGAIRTSTDGISWTAQTSNTTANLRAIHCVSTTCVAVGDGGTVVSTADGGTTWTAQTVAGTPAFKGVVYGNNNNNTDNVGTVAINTWAAVADNGIVAYSTDGGSTWTSQTVAGAGNLVAIRYTTRFVAVDTAGSAFASANAQTWSAAIPTGAANLTALTSNGYGFVAVGAGGVNVSSF